MEKVRCSSCGSDMEYSPFYTRRSFPPMEGIQLTCRRCLESARHICQSGPVEHVAPRASAPPPQPFA